jgi:drug/metabolite transporter (DMT)-like permease
LIWLPVLMLLGPLGVYAGIIAAKHASAAMLGPYTLLRLGIGIIGGGVLFNELPDRLSCIGVMTILLSCIMATRGVAIFGVSPVVPLLRRNGLYTGNGRAGEGARPFAAASAKVS